MERPTGRWEHLPDYLDWEAEEYRDGVSRSRFRIQPHHIAGNGFLHATCLVGLADLTCAGGSFATVPEGGSFTTIELKINLLGTARDGVVTCEARLQHGGRTTQVWDAECVHQDSGRKLALFRCTQLVLHPKG
jgi:1,4-dihydroxy-2-naphthoyl-CoA hydrolase